MKNMSQSIEFPQETERVDTQLRKSKIASVHQMQSPMRTDPALYCAGGDMTGCSASSDQLGIPSSSSQKPVTGTTDRQTDTDVRTGLCVRPIDGEHVSSRRLREIVNH